MIRNISEGDIAKILAAHRAAERSKAIDGLGYLRSVKDDEPVEIIPTQVFKDVECSSSKDNEQKDFENFLKLIGAITLAGIIDEAENKNQGPDISVLKLHQAKLDAYESKRKASELIQLLNGLIG